MHPVVMSPLVIFAEVLLLAKARLTCLVKDHDPVLVPDEGSLCRRCLSPLT